MADLDTVSFKWNCNGCKQRFRTRKLKIDHRRNCLFVKPLPKKIRKVSNSFEEESSELEVSTRPTSIDQVLQSLKGKTDHPISLKRMVVVEGCIRVAFLYDGLVYILVGEDKYRRLQFRRTGFRTVTIDHEQKINLNLCGDPQIFEVSGKKHIAFFGGPTQEFNMDGTYFECYFGRTTTPLTINIDGDLHSFEFQGPPPPVMLGAVLQKVNSTWRISEVTISSDSVNNDEKMNVNDIISSALVNIDNITEEIYVDDTISSDSVNNDEKMNVNDIVSSTLVNINNITEEIYVDDTISVVNNSNNAEEMNVNDIVSSTLVNINNITEDDDTISVVNNSNNAEEMNVNECFNNKEKNDAEQTFFRECAVCNCIVVTPDAYLNSDHMLWHEECYNYTIWLSSLKNFHPEINICQICGGSEEHVECIQYSTWLANLKASFKLTIDVQQPIDDDDATPPSLYRLNNMLGKDDMFDLEDEYTFSPTNQELFNFETALEDPEIQFLIKAEFSERWSSNISESFRELKIFLIEQQDLIKTSILKFNYMKILSKNSTDNFIKIDKNKPCCHNCGKIEDCHFNLKSHYSICDKIIAKLNKKQICIKCFKNIPGCLIRHETSHIKKKCPLCGIFVFGFIIHLATHNHQIFHNTSG